MHRNQDMGFQVCSKKKLLTFCIFQGKTLLADDVCHLLSKHVQNAGSMLAAGFKAPNNASLQ